MFLATVFFYIFSAVLIGSAFMVITSRNPVHSVLFLILAFANAAGLMLLLGAEFLALILVVVYVGAVAVLFLFVVMMLDIDFAELRQGFLNYLPVGALIGAVLLIELIAVLAGAFIDPELRAAPVMPIPEVALVPNIEAIGVLLYTRYVYFFQAAGLILLVAMIGAIVLTLREQRPDVRRQDITAQNARTKEGGVEVVDVPTGQGL